MKRDSRPRINVIELIERPDDRRIEEAVQQRGINYDGSNPDFTPFHRQGEAYLRVYTGKGSK